jgi:hypothetical protein
VFQTKKVVHVKISQVLSISSSDAAWQHIAAVSGAMLPAKPPTLFGVLRDSDFLGLVYETDDGKQGAMLLETLNCVLIARVLSKLTGKPIENAP